MVTKGLLTHVVFNGSPVVVIKCHPPLMVLRQHRLVLASQVVFQLDSSRLSCILRLLSVSETVGQRTKKQLLKGVGVRGKPG